MPRVQIGVVGAGVMGLSSAVNILDELDNVDVTIVAEAFSPHTTGDVSAGFWEPYASSGSNIRKWAKVTFDYAVKLAQSDLAGRLGVQFCSGYSLGKADIDWADIVFGYRPMTDEEHALFPTSGTRSGHFYTTVMIEVTMYLPWLMQRFKDKGGKVIHRKVDSLETLSGEFDVVVNCCGLSAWSLANDKSVMPMRGQVIKVHAPWIKHFVIHADKYPAGSFACVFPGAKWVTVGGMVREGDWNTSVEETDKQGIWQRCVELVPSITEAKHLRDWAGLRPFRPEVRLELEEIPVNGTLLPVIHNYGHGGSGVTLHMGCAKDVTALVRETVRGITGKTLTTSKL